MDQRWGTPLDAHLPGVLRSILNHPQVNWKCWTTCKSFVTRNSIVSAMWGVNIPLVLDVLVWPGVVKACNPSPSLSHRYHHVYLFTNQFSLNELGLHILNFKHHNHSQNAENSLITVFKKRWMNPQHQVAGCTSPSRIFLMPGKHWQAMLMGRPFKWRMFPQRCVGCQQSNCQQPNCAIYTTLTPSFRPLVAAKLTLKQESEYRHIWFLLFLLRFFKGNVNNYSSSKLCSNMPMAISRSNSFEVFFCNTENRMSPEVSLETLGCCPCTGKSVRLGRNPQ